MKKYLRFIALVTLMAFIGLSAVETFHSHQAHQTADSCPICQIAHRSPTLLTSATVIGPHWTSAPAYAAAAPRPIVRFVSVAHGLSPPRV